MVQRHLREEGRRPETRDQRPQPAMVRPLPGPSRLRPLPGRGPAWSLQVQSGGGGLDFSSWSAHIVPCGLGTGHPWEPMLPHSHEQRVRVLVVGAGPASVGHGGG